MRKLLAYVAILVFLAWAVTRIVISVQFERAAGGYLKRAADANVIELAIQNLEVTVQYLDREGLTEGYTSVLWRTPDEDVGFWYVNLNASLVELRGVSPDATPLERSNVLMKLRETLLDGSEIPAPSGISIFPSNTVFFLWGWFGLALFCAVVAGPIVRSVRDDLF